MQNEKNAKYESDGMATSGISRVKAILEARAALRPEGAWFPRSPEAEGGCGVTGFACTIPVGGKHIYEPSIQMRNRGNGKGGGIAACGLVPEELGVSRRVLEEDYILQVALLDPAAQGEVEKTFIEPFFDVDQGGLIPTVDDYRDVPLLEVRPPDVARYFVRVKPGVLARFADEILGKGDSPLLPERPATRLRSVPGFAPMETVPFFRSATAPGTSPTASLQPKRALPCRSTPNSPTTRHATSSMRSASS